MNPRDADVMLYSKGIALDEEPGRSAHSVEQSRAIIPGIVRKWRKQYAKDEESAFQ